MGELVDFIKEMFMLNVKDTTPVGLCAFETSPKKCVRRVKKKVNREMRLSELMDK